MCSLLNLKNGKPGTKAQKHSVVENMLKDDSIKSAGTTADSSAKDEITSASSNDTKPLVVGSPSHALRLECLKIANSFAGSINAIEQNYSRLLSMVNLSE